MGEENIYKKHQLWIRYWDESLWSSSSRRPGETGLETYSIYHGSWAELQDSTLVFWPSGQQPCY